MQHIFICNNILICPVIFAIVVKSISINLFLLKIMTIHIFTCYGSEIKSNGEEPSITTGS